MATAKVRDILAMLKRDGWFLERQTGSHRQFRHPAKPRTVTVNGHPNETLGHDLTGSILKQAGLRKDDLK
jgi:predicted RNA binding protein YcfA (HicA-like mRNA interferase family)